MTRYFLPSVFALIACFSLVSCADQKPTGPVSNDSQLSWTGQVTNPIQGQLGMLPQNQYRR